MPHGMSIAPVIEHPAKTPRVWLLMGHRAGDNSQVLALAESLGWSFEIKRFTYRPTELASNLLLGPTLAGVNPGKSSDLHAPWPDLIITAGRRNEPIARWIQKQASDKHVRIVHVGRTWAKPERFDLIVTTPQYRLAALPNILHNTTPLHRVTEERMHQDAKRWAPRLEHLRKPYIMVVLGGNSGPFTFDAAAGKRLAKQASAMAKSTGGSLLVTTSARTPQAARAAFEKNLSAPAYLFPWTRDAADNPYFAFLSLAQSIIVTGDSMSMLTEACATRKPVYIFDIGEGHRAMRPLSQEELAKAKKFPIWKWGRSHLKAFIYQLSMRLGPKRMTRDIRIVHRKLIESGRAVWLGETFPDVILPPVESVERAVNRVKSLFELEPAFSEPPRRYREPVLELRTAS